MQLIKPYAKMVDVCDREQGIAMLRFCEKAARISHRSEDTVTPDSWERFLRFIVLEHGDFSVIEHRTVTVEFVVDRGITHEIVRHRIAAYTQESTRFVNYEKKMPASFIAPLSPDQINEYAAWDTAIGNVEEAYKYLIGKGVKPQIARSVFPNALASKLWMTANLRTWRHFFLMRTSAEAHPQMREVTIPLLAEFQEKIPILYEDIVPGTKQAQNMRQMR